MNSNCMPRSSSNNQVMKEQQLGINLHVKLSLQDRVYNGSMHCL